VGYRNIIYEGVVADLGLAYIKVGEYAKVVECFTVAIDMREHSPEAKYESYWYFNRGVAHQKLDNDDKAAEDFEKAKEMNPKFRD